MTDCTFDSQLLPLDPGLSTPNSGGSILPTILVTGGAGFIGSHLVERLLAKGYEVICVDNFNDYYDPKLKEQNIAQASNHPNLTLIRGSVLDTELLENIFSGNVERITSNVEPDTRDLRPKKIIHLAALAGVRISIALPNDYVDVDIKGTINLLEIARKHRVKQFIFGSSSSVYGLNEKVPFSEDDPTELQISPYATAKKAGELYCRTYHYLYGVPVTILRFFTVYGPRQRPDMAIRKFTKLMMEKRPISMFGDGTSKRDYTYIDDCIDGVMAAIERPFKFEVFNIGNFSTVKLKCLVDLIAGKLGVNPKIERLPEQLGDVPITHADISKARRLLRYNPKVPLEEGVEYFISWYTKRRAA